MISYISLFALSVFNLGQPSVGQGWSFDGFCRSFMTACDVIQSFTAASDDTGDEVDLAMASPKMVFHANAGPISVDDEEDDAGDDAAPAPVELAADEGAPEPFDSDANFADSDSNVIGAEGALLPTDDPFATDDAPFAEAYVMMGPPAPEDEDLLLPIGGTIVEEPMIDVSAEESDWIPEPFDDSIIQLAVAGDDVPPEETAEPENDDTVDDFQDFGSSPFAKDVHETAPVVDPAANAVTPVNQTQINVSSGEALVPASASQSAPVPNSGGLASELRGKIGITRMTLKDQPTDLIRVAVNSSIVVDLSGSVDAVNIVDPKIAEVIVPKTDRVIVVGKETGTTQLVLTIGDDHRVFHVLVEPNLVVLTSLIKSLAPRSEIKLASVNGQIVLQGFVSDPETARQIAELAKAYQQGREVINHLTVAGTHQTMLRVIVAEVNKEALRNLGFNWAIGGSDWSRDFFFANNVGQLNPTTFGSNGLGNVLAGQMTYGVNPVANGANTNITFGFPKAEMQVFLNALRQNGLSRTLAEPNLVAISGQTATFLAGGEVPIPVAQGGSSTGAITIEYKEFGVRLAFTPTVCADQIVRLHVMTEVSDAVAGGPAISTVPTFTFKTRRVESTIECPNGQTFAIAGLLNETINAVAQKIPGLGDVPVLGSLFTSVDYQKSNTELVVLVTPQLVEALDPQQVVPFPGQNMKAPSDFELFALGELEGRQAKPTADEPAIEPGEGTLVRRSRPMPAQARLQGIYGIEDQEPGALAD